MWHWLKIRTYSAVHLEIYGISLGVELVMLLFATPLQARDTIKIQSSRQVNVKQIEISRAKIKQLSKQKKLKFKK